MIIIKIKKHALNAEAEANKKIAASLTQELIEKTKYEKWNGQLPKVSGATSIVDIGNIDGNQNNTEE